MTNLRVGALGASFDLRNNAPAENRVRRDDACHLTQDPPAEFLAAHRESPALGVGQTKRSRTKMLPEDAILLPEIVDEIFLVAIHPASQSQHEEVQSVGHGRRLHGSDAAGHPRCLEDSLASAVFSHHTGCYLGEAQFWAHSNRRLML